jgi:2-polyprenyl-3-methyl-5-hydroxy-6-metoxy-1,4-benzoquinol methylase
MFRLIRPFVSYQERVNVALLSGLEAHDKTHAEILREMRRLSGEVDNLLMLEAQIGAVPFMAGEPFEVSEFDTLGRVLLVSETRTRTERSSTYVAFEDVFRGTEDFIRERQRCYVPILAKQTGPCVDVGAGRGEMLELLREAGVEAKGVDLDVSMVDRATTRGLNVQHGDGVAFLKDQPSESLGSVFAAQVIEHLAFDVVGTLITSAFAALESDGVLILETVNPHNYAALKTFWVDGTHQHPLFPEVVALMCANAGFGPVAVFCPNGSGDYERDRLTVGEYAVIARKSPIRCG